MKASFVITGSEILKGVRQDMLVQPFAARLTSQGIVMAEIRIIGDDPAGLSRTVLDLEKTSDLIIVTGGLGMTPDDTTEKAVRDLVETGSAGMGPDIENPVGSAKGIDLMFASGARAVFLPGVPDEARAMFDNVVKTLQGGSLGAIEMPVFGLREVEIAKRLGDLGQACGYLPRDMEVVLTVPQGLENDVRMVLGRHVLEEKDLATTVASLLKGRGLSCAAAESCTGGLVSHLLTQVPGSSDFFLGGVVSYSNDLKVKALGVPFRLIERHGAVSREVALAMLQGLLSVTGADVGMATTGIAGPAGGSPDKPVGTVWIAAGGKENPHVADFRFFFDRTRNKMIFAKTALFLLREHIHDQGLHRI